MDAEGRGGRSREVTPPVQNHKESHLWVPWTLFYEQNAGLRRTAPGSAGTVSRKFQALATAATSAFSPAPLPNETCGHPSTGPGLGQRAGTRGGHSGLEPHQQEQAT